MTKKTIAILAVASIMLIGGILSAAIEDTAHDFSEETWSGGEICAPCHTPHNAMSMDDAPLWNHEVTLTTFDLYQTGGSMNATSGQPQGVSRLCLSCHDGTVAIDSFGGNTGAEMITGDANLGTDLSTTHPISITYDTLLSSDDGELFDPWDVSSDPGLPGGDTIAECMLFGTGNDRLECASCHDVHGVVGIPSFLVKANDGSALCMTCHDK